MVNLEDEIAYLKKYISIQNYRFGELFVIYYEIEPGLEQMQVMRLILQPMIENSIDHGIRPLRRLGSVSYTHLDVYKRQASNASMAFRVASALSSPPHHIKRSVTGSCFSSNAAEVSPAAVPPASAAVVVPVVSEPQAQRPAIRMTHITSAKTREIFLISIFLLFLKALSAVF